MSLTASTAVCYNLGAEAWTDAPVVGLALGIGKVDFLTVSCR